jgi:hypothetical protein
MMAKKCPEHVIMYQLHRMTHILNRIIGIISILSCTEVKQDLSDVVHGKQHFGWGGGCK